MSTAYNHACKHCTHMFASALDLDVHCYQAHRTAPGSTVSAPAMPSEGDWLGERFARIRCEPPYPSVPDALKRLCAEERAAARLGADSHGRADERAAIVKWLRNAAKARPAIINPDYLEHFALNIEMGAHSVWCSAPPQKTQEETNEDRL